MKHSEIHARAESGDYCFIFRDAIQNNWIDWKNTLDGDSSCRMWACTFLGDKPYPNRDQIQAYLCESLASALYHADHIIAFRACIQATEYLARLHAMGWAGGGRYEDAHSEARQRIERYLVCRRAGQ